VVNDLLGIVADPNVLIQESKVATCDVLPGRRPRGAELTALLARLRASAGITAATGTTLLTTDGSGPDGTGPGGSGPSREAP